MSSTICQPEPLKGAPLVFFDTETTGLSWASGDRLCEIAAMKFSPEGEFLGYFHEYVNPCREIHPRAQAVHGLTSEFLDDKPLFSDVAFEFAEYIRGCSLVAHNALFDTGFIENELAISGAPTLSELGCSVVDTLAMAKRLYPGQKNTLDALCDRFHVDRSGRIKHGAMIDTELLVKVYDVLMREALMQKRSCRLV